MKGPFQITLSVLRRHHENTNKCKSNCYVYLKALKKNILYIA